MILPPSTFDYVGMSILEKNANAFRCSSSVISICTSSRLFWFVYLGSDFVRTSVISVRKISVTFLTWIDCISCFKSASFVYGVIGSTYVMVNCFTVFR